MKTNFEKTTENTTQKGYKKSMISVICITLVSLTLTAQNIDYFTFENFTEEGNAFAMSNKKISLTTGWTHTNEAKSLASFEKHQAKHLDDLKSVTNYFIAVANLIPENEKPMELENWMNDEAHFKPGLRYLVPATENKLQIEDWMTNENHFNHNSFRLEQATENKLDFENWMFNDVLFTGIQETENPLTIENWMISEQVWK